MDYENAHKVWDHLHEISSIIYVSRSRHEKGSEEYAYLDSLHMDAVSMACKFHKYLNDGETA